MVSNLNEFKQEVKQWIRELIVASSVSREEFNKMIRDAVNQEPSLKDRGDRIISFETTIDNMKEIDEIKSFYEGVSNLVKAAQKQAWDDRKKEQDKLFEPLWDQIREMDKIIEENKKYRQEADEWWEKYQADEKKRKENNEKILKEYVENKKKQEREEGDSFVEGYRKMYIEEIERRLRNTDGKVSEAALNKKLGVSDWREEIKKKNDIVSAQSKKFEVEEAVRKLNDEVVCDYCKETKSPILGADAYAIPSKKKKFCSQDCKMAWEKENNDENASSNGRKPAAKKHAFSIAEVFSAMKTAGIDSISIDSTTNQVIVKYKNNTTEKLEDSNLPGELKSQVKSEIETTRQPITFDQISSEYNKEKSIKDKGGNGGIIVAIVGVGLVLAIVIGVVIYKNKQRDY